MSGSRPVVPCSYVCTCSQCLQACETLEDSRRHDGEVVAFQVAFGVVCFDACEVCTYVPSGVEGAR